MKTEFSGPLSMFSYSLITAALMIIMVSSGSTAIGQETRDQPHAAEGAFEEDALNPASADLPTVQEVVDRYHETQGGEEAVRNITSTRSRAKMEITGLAERRGILTNSWSAPNMIHTTTAYRDSGVHIAASDGKLHWIVSEITGNRVVNGSEAELTRTMNNPHRYLNREELYDAVIVLGFEEFNGTQCYKLEFFTPDGGSQYHFFDVESGRLSGMQYDVDTPAEYTVTARYDDYREVDGCILPFHISQEYSLGMRAEVDYLSRELNVEHDASLFEIPEEINELLLNDPPRRLVMPALQLRPAEPLEVEPSVEVVRDREDVQPGVGEGTAEGGEGAVESEERPVEGGDGRFVD